MAAEKKMRAMLEQSENVAYPESAVHKDYGYERLDSSQGDLGEVLKGAESEKYEVEVSESKKVRLEADSDEVTWLSRRVELLESDNKRLSAELVTIHQSKLVAEAKMESLMTDKVRLEIELVKERTKRIFGVETLPSDSRDKEMNASVAVVSELCSSSSRDAATSPEPSRRSSSKACFHSSQMRKKIEEGMAKIAQLGIVTVTSCNPGDVVLVFWDPVHSNYAVYQESATLYFLHSDYVDTLEVRMNSNGSRKCVLAEVIDKEYCHARKVRLCCRLNCATAMS